jgi:hypothetical protein
MSSWCNPNGVYDGKGGPLEFIGAALSQLPLRTALTLNGLDVLAIHFTSNE